MSKCVNWFGAVAEYNRRNKVKVKGKRTDPEYEAIRKLYNELKRGETKAVIIPNNLEDKIECKGTERKVRERKETKEIKKIDKQLEKVDKEIKEIDEDLADEKEIEQIDKELLEIKTELKRIDDIETSSKQKKLQALLKSLKEIKE